MKQRKVSLLPCLHRCTDKRQCSHACCKRKTPPAPTATATNVQLSRHGEAIASALTAQSNLVDDIIEQIVQYARRSLIYVSMPNSIKVNDDQLHCLDIDSELWESEWAPVVVGGPLCTINDRLFLWDRSMARHFVRKGDHDWQSRACTALSSLLPRRHSLTDVCVAADRGNGAWMVFDVGTTVHWSADDGRLDEIGEFPLTDGCLVPLSQDRVVYVDFDQVGLAGLTHKPGAPDDVAVVQWCLLRNLRRTGGRAIQLPGPTEQVLITGGNYKARSCEIYDVVSNTVKCCARMSTARAYHGIVLVDGTVYVLGGQKEMRKYESRGIDSVERYNAQLDQWTVLSCKLPRRGPCSAAVLSV